MKKSRIANSPGGGLSVAGRRNPVQERSHVTVQRIIEVTSKLLATLPSSEITTTRIARNAKVSVGALYRFFPDKQSIVDAIAVRHVEEFRASFEGRIAQFNFADGPAFLSAVIDAFVEFLDSRPDFRAIAFGPQISAQTRRQQTDPDAMGAGLVKRFMTQTLGMPDIKSLDLRLRIAIESGERLFAYAYEQNDPEERKRIVGEIKRLLSGYLFD
jgi:AcrR family transcriptional regulator